MIGYPGADVLSPDRTFLDLLNEASNDLGSRFFNRIREQMGLAYFVGAGNFAGLAPGSFVFFLGTDPKKVEAVTAELQQEIEALSKDGLTEEELARAKKSSSVLRQSATKAIPPLPPLSPLMNWLVWASTITLPTRAGRAGDDQ